MTMPKPQQRQLNPLMMGCREGIARLAFLSLIFLFLWTYDHDPSVASQADESSSTDLLILPPHDPYLASLLQSSAFDKSLYDAFRHPFVEFPCQPHKIHLSPKSNVDASTQKVNMTLSFSLDRTHCSNSANGVHIIVVYGRGVFPEGRIEQRGGTAESSVYFNYTSPATGEFYQSDWIQHVTLPSLQAGSKEYWYRIQVQDYYHHVSDMFMPSRPVFLRGTLYKVGETPTLHFRTPPLYHQPTSLALVGDLG